MRRMLLTALALVTLTGCSPNAREPADLALVRVLGVDGASPVVLTAVCGSAAGQEPIRGSCRGESLDIALARLPWVEDEELGLASVSYLVCGADADLTAVLFAVLEDRELGPSAGVWLTESSEALLEDCRDPAAELELLAKQGVQAPTAAGALGTLLTQGGVLLPVLAVLDGKLTVQGEVRWSER